MPLETIVNETWSDGMASSIRAGMERLTAHDVDTDAVVLMLCDQPLLDADVINKLVTAFRTTNALLVAAKYDGTRGVPALFDRRLYPALLALAGAQGTKSIISLTARSSRKSLRRQPPSTLIRLPITNDSSRVGDGRKIGW